MVTYDPSSGAYSKGKDPSAPPTQYHVQFFGDSPLRAWVSGKTGMRAWEGPQGAGDDLRRLLEALLATDPEERPASAQAVMVPAAN